MLRDLILKNRSYRRFYQHVAITEELLKEWIDLARCSASARNMQPLKYIICTNQIVNEQIFDQLAWAGYLTDWPGPEIGERPSAYIVMLHDTAIAANYLCDDGIAAQSILLGATEAGFGGCMIYSVNRSQLRETLKIQEYYQIIQVLAIGKPKETVVLDEVQNGEIKYWRDEDMVHHVPKRTLEELVIQTI